MYIYIYIIPSIKFWSGYFHQTFQKQQLSIPEPSIFVGFCVPPKRSPPFVSAPSSEVLDSFTSSASSLSLCGAAFDVRHDDDSGIRGLNTERKTLGPNWVVELNHKLSHMEKICKKSNWMTLSQVGGKHIKIFELLPLIDEMLIWWRKIFDKRNECWIPTP